MAAKRAIAQLTKNATNIKAPAAGLTRSVQDGVHYRNYATLVPPVTQNGDGSRGPTAMVFMNMGGPSTTAEVGDFLSRLFVSFVIFGPSTQRNSKTDTSDTG